MKKKEISNFLILFSLAIPHLSLAEDKHTDSKKEETLKNLPSNWEATILDKPIDVNKLKKNHHQAQSHGNGGNTANNDNAADNNETVTKKENKNLSHQILIPIPPHIGIAAYYSGNEFIIVLDKNIDMDISALRGDSIFQDLNLENIFNTTLIRIPLIDNRTLYLSQKNEGWILGDTLPQDYNYDSRKVINPQIIDNNLLYPMERPGRVVNIHDPITGTNLLVGTSISDSGGVLSFRKGDNYDIWGSVEGVIIAPHNKNISLKSTPIGDILEENGQKISDLDKAVYATDIDYDWLGLRNQSLEEMKKRYHDALIAVADAAPPDRFQKRVNLAQAALNMGAFPESLAILNVALNDNPEGAMSPKVRFLLAVSQLLSGKTENADFLDTDWPDNEKRALQLWKGIYLNKTPNKKGEATPFLAHDFDRLKTYPEPIKNALLPDVIENIVRYGDDKEKDVLGDILDDKKYQFMKALDDLNNKKTDEAYKIFQKLINNKNMLQGEKAYEEKVKLDLKNNKINPKIVADQMDERIFDARLTGRQDDLKLLQAQAYMQAGEWNDALMSIDKLKTLPKEQLFKILASIAVQEHDHNDKKSLLRTAASIDSHLNDFSNGAQKGELLLSYGRVLTDLGLWDKAVSAYSDAIPMLNSPSLRGKAGANLADVFLKLNKPDDALNALKRTDDAILSPNISQVRKRLMAVADLQKNNQIDALGLLDNANDWDSLLLKASIHEKNNEWEAALGELKKAIISNINSNDLNKEQENLILRYATDASHINDDLALSWIYQFVGNKNMTDDTKKIFLILTKQKKLFSTDK